MITTAKDFALRSTANCFDVWACCCGISLCVVLLTALMHGRAAVGLVMCGGARLHGVRCYATGMNASFMHSDAVASVGLYRKNENIF